MKKTTISMMLLGLLCAPQFTYAEANKCFQQSVIQRKTPLIKIFEKLSKEHGVKFFYSVSDLKDIQVDESQVNYQSLSSSLDYLKKNVGLDFNVDQKTVTVRLNARAIAKIQRNNAQQSAEYLNPIKDTVTSREKNIDEVVLVGYGKQSKKNNSGSISSIDEKQMKGVASSNFGDIIAGKATGVQITQANATPGGSPSIRVRGIGTLTAGSNPLIVVDGLPLTEGSNLNAIDPNSIAKIDILKDAASAAIYGSRGANGVIIIETKQGKKGRMAVSFDSYYGMQMRSDNVKLVNAYDMATFLKEARDNNYLSKGSNRSISDDNATRISKGASLRELIPDYLAPYLAKQPGLTDTDWLNTVMKPAPISQTSLNVTGGSDKSKYAFTMSYFNQKGLVIGTDYEKFSTSVNLSTELTDKWKIGVTMTPSYATGTINAAENSRSYNPLQMATAMYPFFKPYNDDGSLAISKQILGNTATDGALVENPVAIQEMTNRKYTLFKTFGNIFTEIELLKGLKYRLSVGGDYTNYEYNFFDPSTVGAYRAAAPDVTFANRTEYIRKNYLIENLLSFDQKWGEHRIDAIAGQSFQQEDNTQLLTEATAFPDNSIRNIAGGTSFKNTLTQYKWRLMSYFTRVNYTFDNKYNLMASYRRDGSSRFGKNSKWGDFYAFSAGWTISNENFFPENTIVTDLKLRYSLGSNGNNQIPNFGALSLMNPDNYNFGGVLTPGYTTATAPNPNISWEKSRSNNFGIDFSLFKNILNISADYYILNRDGLLLDVPVPQQSGFSTSLQNIGKIKNSGFELQIASKTFNIANDFTYSGSFNFSTNKNEVLALANGQNQIITGENNFSVTKVGGSIGEMYGYNIVGIYKTQEEINNSPHITGTMVGDYIMEDLNGDGKIDVNDKRSFGSGVPKYILGFNNNFRYGLFELSFSLYSEIGKRIYNADAVTTLESGEGFGMASQYYFDNRYNAATNPNGFFGMPNMNFSNNRKEARTSNLYFKNADYVRLRSLRLAFNFPKSMLGNIGLENAQVYLVGNNLFTLSKYKGMNIDATSDNVLTQGFDQAYYPVAKIYSVGFNLKF
ncbi:MULTISPECIES: SusC/RagA family TonB-linked outer membrane protein [unclassified Chryseobacterium]|uniref:SusC/RagA family TonB-linked outer membrane protein n=1 Tax=unclassified Chryseobacterium TaxID=2593645 RepID=UPI00285356AA|nr:SusC/RagA family TonB-linked outer membrane protein [Chryseobacterium sp. CFS7]MDR4892191.1 SusC/RagA family TonB-linked outer membrane protein [Chryseobacterium sp. CFS7]